MKKIIAFIISLILIGLGAIWWRNIQMKEQLSEVRDTNRIAQLDAMKGALELYLTKSSLPVPDNKIDIIFNGKLVAYQWYIWKKVLETIEYTESWLDPENKTYFTYILSKNKKFFQLFALLENNWLEEGGEKNNHLKYPHLIWNIKWREGLENFGVFTDSSNIPIQENVKVSNKWEINLDNLWKLKLKSFLSNKKFITDNFFGSEVMIHDWWKNISWNTKSRWTDIDRISQLNAMTDALELYWLKNTLPMPDDKIQIRVWNRAIAYQWYLWKDALKAIEYTASGLDSKDKEYFIYYLTRDKKYFQLLALLENPDDDKKEKGMRYPLVRWKSLGVLTNIDNKPINNNADAQTKWWIDLKNLWDLKLKAFLGSDQVIVDNNKELLKLNILARKWWRGYIVSWNEIVNIESD